jgi:hypothetical protein
MSRAVEIVEVGPRDGLQNESVLLEVAEKLEFIARLEAAACGGSRRSLRQSLARAADGGRRGDHGRAWGDAFRAAPASVLVLNCAAGSGRWQPVATRRTECPAPTDGFGVPV